jgi:predicted nucleic acid-binding Zn ribbon protein
MSQNKKRQFKVELRKTCKICGQPITENRYRTYCSEKCRNKSNNQKNYHAQLEWGREKRGQYASDKKKCIICGKWYRQVGSHIIQQHGLTAREYRELYNLPVKRGITTPEYRKFKGEQTKENGTFKNLRAGKKYRYKKGDERAKTQTFYKSTGKYKATDYYG